MAFENSPGLPVEPATFQLYVPALSALWGDSGIREAYSRRSEFQLVRELRGVFQIHSTHTQQRQMMLSGDGGAELTRSA